MHHHFHAEQWVPFNIVPLFGFFANPHNLPRLSDPKQKLRIEEAFLNTPPPPPVPVRTMAAGAGSHISISFRPPPWFFARMGWQLEIVEFVWNDHFMDRQISGPFAFWQHTHSFKEETRNDITGTLLLDDIEYEMKAGALGELMQPFMQRNLEKMFADRHKKLEELLKKAS